MNVIPRFDAAYQLSDRYLRREGRVFLTGTQALVRLPIMQRWIDVGAGLNTAGFISGYRGSPLGGYDRELIRAKDLLEQNHIHFQPGLNEDLAATAVWGSQQLEVFDGPKYDGVFGIWYGKGPGVDRSGDAMRHANTFGTARHGGVLALAGDDHGAQSSTISHQSEHVFMGFMMPILNPASVAEYLWLGLAGIAMSRFSGCWVSFKAITETVESASSILIDPDAYKFATPEEGEYERPPKHRLNFDPTLQWPAERHELERLVQRYRTRAAYAFARKNRLDRIVLDSPNARIGILTTGKTYHDLMQALKDLEIDERTAKRIGLRICKVAMTWPLEPEMMKEFADGLEEIIVMEEKREVMEPQVKWQLFNLPADRRPVIIGKEDEEGKVWLPCDDELSPRMIARLLASRLRLHHLEGDIDGALAAYEARKFATPPTPAKESRIPFYCSGCPHNTSTKVPDGSMAMGGIGCHIMALSMKRKTELFTHMGGEGVNWVGAAPFTEQTHVFQNLGDGTYEHSGILAIRQAVHANVNITYKILYNDAVAMTGGQAIDSHLSVPAIMRQVQAEGVSRVAIVGDVDIDELEKRYGMVGAKPKGVSIHHRKSLDDVQRELREVKGVSVLIFDQTCAAEKRRRRKRGLLDDPKKRVVINELVCEGCGDCSVQSNCISVEPVETEFGQKRAINQSSCNKDFSCVDGFCPAFVTIEGGELRKPKTAASNPDLDALINDLIEPTQPEFNGHAYNILVTGIGGTGVVTIGALIGMAAHLEDKGVTTLDFTGLAQKNGAVTSHLKIGPSPTDMHAVRVGKGETHLLLGCDMVVAAGADALARSARGRTNAIINTHVAPTAAFTLDKTAGLPGPATIAAIVNAIGDESVETVDATGIATALFGDSIASNLFMLGLAHQRGLVPLAASSIERAIELNNVAVDQNLRAFRYGRVYAVAPDAIDNVLAPKAPQRPFATTLDEIINRRVEHLTTYQNKSYADRYRAFVTRVAESAKQVTPNDTRLAEAVARNYFKLLAYKDEYEVARLLTDQQFERSLMDRFEGDIRIKYNMAPPILSAMDVKTKRPQKREFKAAYMRPLLKLLARLKGLRGTPFDPFQFGADRKLERALIAKYEQDMQTVTDGLHEANYRTAVEIAQLPAMVAGYGPVKAETVTKADNRRKALLANFANPLALQIAAE